MLTVRPEEKYFTAWRQHSWEMLSSITTQDIIYQIDDKRTLSGHAALEEYWNRNSTRQDQIEVFSTKISEGRRYGSYIFSANFQNKIKGVNQSIYGRINFYLNADGVICRISEKYTKIVHGEDVVPQQNRDARWVQIREFIRRHLNLKNIEFFTVVLILLGVGFYVVLLLPPVAKVIGVELSKSLVTNIFAPYLTVSSILFVGMNFLSSRIGSRKSIKVHTIHDINSGPSIIMSGYLNGAKRADVFAGDFNFFEDQVTLINAFEQLDIRNSLTFYSQSSFEQVVSATQSMPRTNQLIKNLISKGRMHFNANVTRVRATYIEKHGDQIVLNRPREDKIIAFFGVNENATVVQLLQGLMKRNAENSVGPKTKNTKINPNIILICGRTYSGKTSIATKLENQGYVRISVGRELDSFFGEASKTRNQKIKKGKRLISAQKQKEFFHHLCDQILMHEKVVLDGLRLPLVVRLIKEQFGNDMEIMFVYASKGLIEARHKSSGERLSLKTIADADDYFKVDEISEISDSIFSGANSHSFYLVKSRNG